MSPRETILPWFDRSSCDEDVRVGDVVSVQILIAYIATSIFNSTSLPVSRFFRIDSGTETRPFSSDLQLFSVLKNKILANITSSRTIRATLLHKFLEEVRSASSRPEYWRRLGERFLTKQDVVSLFAVAYLLEEELRGLASALKKKGGTGGSSSAQVGGDGVPGGTRDELMMSGGGFRGGAASGSTWGGSSSFLPADRMRADYSADTRGEPAGFSQSAFSSATRGSRPCTPSSRYNSRVAGNHSILRSGACTPSRTVQDGRAALSQSFSGFSSRSYHVAAGGTSASTRRDASPYHSLLSSHNMGGAAPSSSRGAGANDELSTTTQSIASMLRSGTTNSRNIEQLVSSLDTLSIDPPDHGLVARRGAGGRSTPSVATVNNSAVSPSSASSATSLARRKGETDSRKIDSLLSEVSKLTKMQQQLVELNSQQHRPAASPQHVVVCGGGEAPSASPQHDDPPESTTTHHHSKESASTAATSDHSTKHGGRISPATDVVAPPTTDCAIPTTGKDQLLIQSLQSQLTALQTQHELTLEQLRQKDFELTAKLQEHRVALSEAVKTRIETFERSARKREAELLAEKDALAAALKEKEIKSERDKAAASRADNDEIRCLKEALEAARKGGVVGKIVDIGLCMNNRTGDYSHYHNAAVDHDSSIQRFLRAGSSFSISPELLQEAQVQGAAQATADAKQVEIDRLEKEHQRLAEQLKGLQSSVESLNQVGGAVLGELLEDFIFVPTFG